MTQNYVLVTDNACDLSEEMLSRMGIPFVSLNVFMKDAPALPCTLSHTDFYHALRSGQVACTSAANLSQFRELFSQILAEGKDILYLAFSSALSCMYATGKLAAEELQEEYPDRRIIVIDSLCASLGQGLLVYHAAQKREAGATLEELAAYLTEQRLKTVHWFTVDDLMYLKRGGRVSTASALAGTLLGIKPIMRVNNEGKLTVYSKVRGRKASLQMLAKRYCEECTAREAPVYICQADCLADAECLKEMLQTECGVKHITIGEIGGVIGSHTGPGAIGLFYTADERETP